MKYGRYPSNWEEIRKIVKERDNNTCQHCGALQDEVRTSVKGKVYKVALNVAHLDHDPENHSVSIDRLLSLCQSCHLKNDRDNSQALIQRALKSRRISKDSKGLSKPQYKAVNERYRKEVEKLKEQLHIYQMREIAAREQLLKNHDSIMQIIEDNKRLVEEIKKYNPHY